MTPELDIQAVYRAAARLCGHFIRPAALTACRRGNGCLCWHEKALPAALDALHAAYSPEPEEKAQDLPMRVTGGAI